MSPILRVKGDCMKTAFDNTVFGKEDERARVSALDYFEFASIREGEDILAAIRRRTTEAPAKARAARMHVVPGRVVR